MLVRRRVAPYWSDERRTRARGSTPSPTRMARTELAGRRRGGPHRARRAAGAARAEPPDPGRPRGGRPRHVRAAPPRSFVRLPLEALVFFAVVLALPPRLGRVRTALAIVAGIVLGLSSVFKLLDIGFGQALNRPFDPLIDWRYAGSLVELVRDSFGDGPGTVLLVVGGAARRRAPGAAAARGAAAHPGRRAAPATGVAGGGRARVALAGPGRCSTCGATRGTLASSDTAGYVYGQVSRIPSELRDQRRVRGGGGGRPAPRRPARRAADRAARQGRPVRVRRELRPGGGRGVLLLAGRQRGPRLGDRASWRRPASPAAART